MGAAKKLEQPVRVTTPNGASAGVEDGLLTLRTNDGALLAQFDPESGALEIAAPRGDLRLVAPSGKVVIEAGTDVELIARRDVAHHADRKLTLTAGENRSSSVALDPNKATLRGKALEATSERASLHTTEASVLAERVMTTATHLAWSVGRVEIKAERWIERVKDAYRDVEGLLQTRAGCARMIVRDTYQMMSRRSRMVSTEDTSIDGKRVLLG